MGGYICCPPIDDIVCLVVPCCLSVLVVDSGYRCDKLIKLDICIPVTVAIYFVPIVEGLSETGSLRGLGKLFYTEVEVVDKDRVICRESYLGELVLVFSDCCAVCADDFTPLWCNLMFENSHVGVLGSRLDVFSLDGLNDVVYGNILEGFVIHVALNR